MFDLWTYLDLHGSEVRSVFGAWNTGLGHGDFLYLDYVLFNNKHIKNAIELGTMHGLTTLYLGVAMALRGGWASSYDIVDLKPEHITKVCRWLPITFRLGDVLNSVVIQAEVSSELQDSATMLFCDDGNKAREVELYAPKMVTGSVLLAHDWGTEIGPANVQATLVTYHFAPYQHEVAEAMNSHLRAWVKA